MNLHFAEDPSPEATRQARRAAVELITAFRRPVSEQVRKTALRGVLSDVLQFDVALPPDSVTGDVVISVDGLGDLVMALADFGSQVLDGISAAQDELMGEEESAAFLGGLIEQFLNP